MSSVIDGPAWMDGLVLTLRSELPANETRRLLVTALVGAKNAREGLGRVRAAMIGRELSVKERHEYTTLIAALSSQEAKEAP